MENRPAHDYTPHLHDFARSEIHAGHELLRMKVAELEERAARRRRELSRLRHEEAAAKRRGLARDDWARPLATVQADIAEVESNLAAALAQTGRAAVLLWRADFMHALIDGLGGAYEANDFQPDLSSRMEPRPHIGQYGFYVYNLRGSATDLAEELCEKWQGESPRQPLARAQAAAEWLTGKLRGDALVEKYNAQKQRVTDDSKRFFPRGWIVVREFRKPTPGRSALATRDATLREVLASELTGRALAATLPQTGEGPVRYGPAPAAGGESS